MTTKPKPVTLFGRPVPPHINSENEREYRLGEVRVTLGQWSTGYWTARVGKPRDEHLILGHSNKSPHAAARALERKIESQWKRLGKLMGKEGKTK